MFLIIGGHPATGKTTLSKKIVELYPDHEIFHTDNYIKYGYKESLYKLLEDLISRLGDFIDDQEPTIIVEGIMGARLMRKLQEMYPRIVPDLYIYISADLDTITDVYTRERADNIRYILPTCKGLDTVNQSIDKSMVHTLEVHIDGSAHEIIHNTILQELK